MPTRFTGHCGDQPSLGAMLVMPPLGTRLGADDLQGNWAEATSGQGPGGTNLSRSVLWFSRDAPGLAGAAEPGLLGSESQSLGSRPGAAASQVTPVRWSLGDRPTAPTWLAQGSVLTWAWSAALAHCCLGRWTLRASLGSWLGTVLTWAGTMGQPGPGGGWPQARCGALLPSNALRRNPLTEPQGGRGP